MTEYMKTILSLDPDSQKEIADHIAANIGYRLIEDREPLPTHTHVKSKRDYIVQFDGKIQSEYWIDLQSYWHLDDSEYISIGSLKSKRVDMREVRVYEAIIDQSHWVRPKEEFNDGRFKEI